MGRWQFILTAVVWRKGYSCHNAQSGYRPIYIYIYIFQFSLWGRHQTEGMRTRNQRLSLHSTVVDIFVLDYSQLTAWSSERKAHWCFSHSCFAFTFQHRHQQTKTLIEWVEACLQSFPSQLKASAPLVPLWIPSGFKPDAVSQAQVCQVHCEMCKMFNSSRGWSSSPAFIFLLWKPWSSAL